MKIVYSSIFFVFLAILVLLPAVYAQDGDKTKQAVATVLGKKILVSDIDPKGECDRPDYNEQQHQSCLKSFN